MEQGYGFTVRGQLLGTQGADRLWEDLALAADCVDHAASAREIAECVNRAENAAPYMLPVARATYGIVADAAADPASGTQAARKLSELILLLKPSALTNALRAEGDPGTRQAFLSDAARVLTVPSLAKVAFAATAAYERPLSPPLRELLKKLTNAASAPAPDGAAAEGVLRETIGSRVQVVPPGSLALTQEAGNARPPKRAPGRVTPEADRLVHMALESGATGELLWIAVSEMVEQGRVRELLEMLKRAPDGATAQAVIRRVATPAALSLVLAEDPLDLELLDMLLRSMGIAAAKPLLEVLAESRSRATRRAVLERLAALGPDIAPLVETRLRDTRWFVVRNMLGLLREAGCPQSMHVVGRFLIHVDARVRREAVQLLLANPQAADDALMAGLKDPDKTVLRAALQAARARLPEAAVPVLAQRVVEDVSFPPEFRVMALHILGRSPSSLALDALLSFAQGGKSLLGRAKLANKSPEMLAALSGLARGWSHDRRARGLIDSAVRSRDAQITAAVRATGE